MLKAANVFSEEPWESPKAIFSSCLSVVVVYKQLTLRFVPFKFCLNFSFLSQWVYNFYNKISWPTVPKAYNKSKKISENYFFLLKASIVC